ncbi:MAG: aminotransferase class V-fold PLP-dependent enzyme [Planctomycetes bacterium]|nr:aminotransferase class V-fold PLP-dependent enzyme [Planctomycetota bacterium]
MSPHQRIYLDNAATSWPKPESVYAIVERYLRELGAPAGRSAYREANEVERLINDARRRLADLLGAEEPSRIVFTCNCTDSLNLAMHGILREGDHVITSVVEHNSVLRPLRYLEETANVQVTRVGCSPEGIIDPDDVRAAIQPNTRLIALVHASNVTGALQPVSEIGHLARERELLYLVDAAQSVGHVPINAREIGADLLAGPGHKGLMGPLGIGFLYIAPGIEEQVRPVRQGGTGTQSVIDQQPSTMPDKYESGNHNVPAILGLGAGAAFLAERGLQEIRRHDQDLTNSLLEGIESVDGVTVHGPKELDQRVGVVSITIDGHDPQDFATMLDSAYSIQVRAGLHCAPLMHQALGTAAGGGTVRLSLGAFNTDEDVKAAVEAVREIAAAGLEA